MSAIVILGSDFGALAAAARLAARGHQVAVVEEADELAPEAKNYPQQFTLPAALRDLFLKTGDAFENHVTLNECDVAYQVELRNKKFAIPGFGVGAVSHAIRDSLGDAAGNQWDSYIRVCRNHWEKLHKHLEDYPKFVENLESMSRRKFLRKPHQLKDPQLISLRDANPLRTSTTSHLADQMPYVSATFGTYEVAGGMATIVDALVQRCNALGVTFHTGEKIAAVNLAGSPIVINVGPQSLIAQALVISTANGAAQDVLRQCAVPAREADFDMTTTHPHIYVVGSLTYPGKGLPLEILSGSMVANLISAQSA